MTTNNQLEPENIVEKVFSVLERWSGYKTLSQAIEKYKDVNVYLVGGVVRNAILNIESSPKDFDFLLTGNGVDAFLHFLELYGLIGYGQFKSPRWYPERNDNCYCDLMVIKNWDTGIFKCSTVDDVLSQFDFTGNAVATDLKDHKFINPINGYQDLRLHILRATRLDFPDRPIRKDTTLTKMAIHWFRFLLYSINLGLEIEPNTRQWMKNSMRFLEQQNVYCFEFNEETSAISEALRIQSFV